MPENAAKIVQLSFRLAAPLRNRFVGLVKGRGLDATQVLRPFVENYVANSDSHGAENESDSISAAVPKESNLGIRSQRQLPIASHDAELIERLSAILASRDATATQAITSLVAVCERLIHVDKGAKQDDGNVEGNADAADKRAAAQIAANKRAIAKSERLEKEISKDSAVARKRKKEAV